MGAKYIGKLFLVAIIVLLFTLRIKFSFIPFTPVWNLGYVFIAILYIAVHYGVACSLAGQLLQEKHFRLFLTVYLLSCVWAMIVIIVRGGDCSYLQSWLLRFAGDSAINIFFVILIYNMLRPSNMLIKFLQVFIFSQCLYVFCSAMFIFVPEIKNAWFSIILQNPLSADLITKGSPYYITRVGLDGFGGFGATMRCTVSLIFCLYLRSVANMRFLIPCIIIMLIGNMFYGRSGMMFSLFSIAFYCMRTLSFKRIGFLFFAVVFIGSAALFTKNIADERSEWSYAARWMLNPFESFVEGASEGRFSLGRSGDAHERQLFLPEEEITLFMGDGKYDNEDGMSYYMRTDSGIVRRLFFFGIIGETLGYLSFVFLLKAAVHGLKQISRKGGSEMFTYFLLCMAFFEIKGTPLTTFMVTMLAVHAAFCMTKVNSKNRSFIKSQLIREKI